MFNLMSLILYRGVTEKLTEFNIEIDLKFGIIFLYFYNCRHMFRGSNEPPAIYDGLTLNNKLTSIILNTSLHSIL